MKNKIIDSNYDVETGVSYVTIMNKYGKFTGYSKLREADKDIASSFAGCRFAHTKARIKSMKAQLRVIRIKIKTLQECLVTFEQCKECNPLSNEGCRIKKNIRVLEKEATKLEKTINTVQDNLRESMQSRETIARDLQKNK